MLLDEEPPEEGVEVRVRVEEVLESVEEDVDGGEVDDDGVDDDDDDVEEEEDMPWPLQKKSEERKKRGCADIIPRPRERRARRSRNKAQPET